VTVRPLAALAALALLGACGREPDPPARREAPREVEPEERCDPTKDRVCVGGSVVACEDGVLGRRLRTCKDGCKDGRCVAVCPEGNELIYVVDRDDNLLSFDPRKLPGDPLQHVGRLACPGSGGPFSMAIDRHGVAWVLYSGGRLFKVSITDAKCEPAPYQPGGLGLFGMGYVTDVAGGKTEKLYVATNGARLLAAIDTEQASPVEQLVGRVSAASDQPPELTGTSEGKLFGFFPMLSDPSFVQEIDRGSGAPVGPKWTLGGSPLGAVHAWAFAHWGGVFYVFVTGGDGLGSTVRAIDRKTGESRRVLENLPYVITGAGVSTCAPEKDQ
jgi:hypothetical protein